MSQELAENPRALLPSYSDERAQAFLDRIERGDRILEVCAENGMPAWATVQKWIRRNADFAAQYARVRAASAEHLEHEAIAESYAPVTDLTDAAARRLRVDTLKWAAGKRNPKTHGDKLLHTGADGESPVGVKLSLDYTLLSAGELLQLKRLIEKATPKVEASAREPLQIEGEVVGDQDSNGADADGAAG